MSTLKIFISYSHDSDDHKAWVRTLGTDLRANGIDVVLDQWDLALGQDLSLFMQNGILKSDRVLMICTPNYVKRAEDGTGGAGYERLIVTAEMVQTIDTIKFIPVARGNHSDNIVPRFIGPRLYSDFRNDNDYEVKLKELLEDLHGLSSSSKPPLGPNPFYGAPNRINGSGHSSGTAGSANVADQLESAWFSEQSAKGTHGITSVDLSAHMELRLTATNRDAKSQIELLNAVKRAEIQTFGWPIGVTLENREEFRPRPYRDGIRAEIAIGEGSKERNSYDYWALSANGDFFLLQSLFEDSRRDPRSSHNTPEKIFFDTRIVRVTESLMFAQRLYQNLGASGRTQIAVRISHHGLRGRRLSSASWARSIAGGNALEDVSISQVITALDAMHDARVSSVRTLLEPLFILFDFQKFEESVYHEIVTDFEKGKIR